jgi:hypothetical protein
MFRSFLLLPFSAIATLVPLWAPTGDFVPGSYVQVANVPLPKLSPQQWEMLRHNKGIDQKPLPIDVGLSVDHGRIYDVFVRHGTGYPGIDRAIVNWIQANWKTASWFVGHEDYVVTLDVDPARRQVVFRNT